MSVADSSPRIMQIVGPRGVLHFLASMRFYTFRFVCPPTFFHAYYNPYMDRNTLGLQVAEVPDYKTEPQIEATPVFADDNITVYSIPIVPTPHCGADLPVATGPPLDLSEASLKRKREPSPELPSKRPSLHSPSPAV